MLRKPANPVGSLAGVAGAVGGWTLSHYCGASLWIPSITALLVFIAFVKTPIRPRRFAGAIAVTIGHIAWFLAASIVMSAWSTVLFDLVLLSGGVAWLWLRPGFVPALFLGAVQLGSLVINAVSLVAADVGSAEHKALAVHCLFRVLALGAIVSGVLQLRRVRSAPASPSGVSRA